MIKSYFSGEKILTNNRFIIRAKLNGCTFFKNNKIKFKFNKEVQIKNIAYKERYICPIIEFFFCFIKIVVKEEYAQENIIDKWL